MATKTQRRPTVAPVLPTKLVPPKVGKGWIARPRLVDALAGAGDARLLLIDAPVGYGKSTLLTEWQRAERGRRSFAWLSLDAADADPARLLAHLAEAIGLQVPGFGERLAPVLSVRTTAPGVGVARLVSELGSLRRPLVIAMDDYHLLRGEPTRRLMRMLLDGLPATVQLAVATRSDPPLPLARMRASGAMLELRASDLRFDDAEAAALLEASGVELPPESVAELTERTEGWPAGLYLAILSLRTDPDPERFVHRFAGTHRHVADYLSEEVLQRLPEPRRTFLVRTSILGQMRADLCDAVLERTGSQAVLQDLERSNLFVVALDDQRRWYRYHHLFGEMLRADLARTEPELAAGLHRRASAWYESEQMPEEAIEHALAARDTDRVADLIARNWYTLFGAGRLATVDRWLDGLGDDAIASHPSAALVAAWVSALTGRPEGMDRWLEVAEREPERGPSPDGSATLGSGAATIRGLFGFRGLRARREELERAVALEPPGGRWRPHLTWGLSHVALLEGDAEQAEHLSLEALRLAEPTDPILRIIALATRSIARSELRDPTTAMDLARQAEAAVDEWGLEADPRVSAVQLALGTAMVADGRVTDGASMLERALELRRSVGRLSPWPTLEVLVVLAPVRLATGERAAAKALLEEAREILAGLEDAGDLPGRIEETERILARAGREVGFGQTLTEREMTVLRLLPTHLSQREIGSQLYLSLNTVKTHSRAIYRKLGVSSRTAAVDRARELQLL